MKYHEVFSKKNLGQYRDVSLNTYRSFTLLYSYVLFYINQAHQTRRERNQLPKWGLLLSPAGICPL